MISYAVPPNPVQCSQLFRLCLSEQVSDVSADIRGNYRALASLVLISANGGLSPGSDHLTDTLSGSSPESRSRLVNILESWAGPLHIGAIDPWISWLNVSGQSPSDEDEEDFFRLSRQMVLAASMPESCQEGGSSPVASATPPATPPAREQQPSAPSTQQPRLRELISDAPRAFCCAIDGLLLVDPVRSPHDGQAVFERAALARALEASGGCCPLSGLPLSLLDCPRAADVRQQIARWVRESRPRMKPKKP